MSMGGVTFSLDLVIRNGASSTSTLRFASSIKIFFSSVFCVSVSSSFQSCGARLKLFP